MENLTMQTPDGVALNVDRIAQLFPGCITETRDADGTVERAVDFDLLRQELSADLVEGPVERYQLNWPGKRQAIAAANAPVNKTLRPCRAESVDFDTTGNLYIEGDNLDVLKLLQETYLGKVKMIYIDPPYNTGKDFIYKDNFTADKDEYAEASGQRDEEGGRLIANLESNGRYHSDWLSMMLPRLRLARNLLRDDGVIFISIDDNEVHNLRKLCDEVFGAEQFVAVVSVQSNPRGRQSDTFVATVHDSLILFAKQLQSAKLNGTPLNEKQMNEFNFVDEASGEPYRLLGLRQRGSASRRQDRPDMYFPIYVDPSSLKVSNTPHSDWVEVFPKKSDGSDGRWMWGKGKCVTDQQLLVARMIDRRNEYDVFVKDYLNRDGDERTRKYKSIWDDARYNNQHGTQEVKSILENDVMSFPKSRHLLVDICQMGSSKEDIILDFFSGSATTAHAAMQLNAEDGGTRKFIMVQLPEACDEKSEAYKAGYKNICEIGKERIRRAGKKIKEENATTAPDLDIGFRVLKLDSSNMRDVYYTPDKLNQTELDLFTAHIKEDRKAEDLLFQVLLDWGTSLSARIEQKMLGGKSVYLVNETDILACFEQGITEEDVKQFATVKPLRAVFRDDAFDDCLKINVEQIFKVLSPDTEVKSI